MIENLRLDSAGWAFPKLLGNLTRCSGDESPREMVAPKSFEGTFSKVPEVAIGVWQVKT